MTGPKRDFNLFEVRSKIEPDSEAWEAVKGYLWILVGFFCAGFLAGIVLTSVFILILTGAR